MRISSAQVISELREQLQFEMGRHLYGVLGSYAQLAKLEQTALSQALDAQGNRFPDPINLNRQLLARIGDEDLRRLVQGEARRPQAIRRRLDHELDSLLGEFLQGHHFLILKQLELVFAYDLDLSVFRTRATNQNHILLLLPGERRGDHVILFQEVDARFHRTIPLNLVAENHLWELRDG
jgi:hypothetical protein